MLGAILLAKYWIKSSLLDISRIVASSSGVITISSRSLSKDLILLASSIKSCLLSFLLFGLVVLSIPVILAVVPAIALSTKSVFSFSLKVLGWPLLSSKGSCINKFWTSLNLLSLSSKVKLRPPHSLHTLGYAKLSLSLCLTSCSRWHSLQINRAVSISGLISSVNLTVASSSNSWPIRLLFLTSLNLSLLLIFLNLVKIMVLLLSSLRLAIALLKLLIKVSGLSSKISAKLGA